MKKKSNNKVEKDLNRYVTGHIGSDGVMYEMIWDSEKNTALFVSNGGGGIRELPAIKEGKLTYLPLSSTNAVLEHNIVKLPSGTSKYSSINKLRSEIEEFIGRYVALSLGEVMITTIYVMLSWVFDRFNEVPYLRVRGDYGTGKTRFLRVVGSLCYKPITTSGASTVAPLFHIIDKIGGTLVLDEADFRYSSETADMTKILNNGNAKGFPVLRCQKTSKGSFEPVAYQVYGPKIIASRGDYQDEALESRCITIDMKSIGTHSTIPVSLPEDFERLACQLRNKLLSYRLTEGEKERVLDAQRSDLLGARSMQIYAPMLAVAVTDEDRAVILAFAKDKQDQMLRDRGLTVEAELLRLIKHHGDTEKTPLAISALANAFRSRYGKFYERPVSPKWIGSLVRTKLRLATRKTNGRYVITEGQRDKLNALYSRFDITDESAA